ncbi:MAG: ATP-dependent helicase C-terminal domain-containing protein, partial [Ferrovibrionaceae bacterium]
PDRIAQLRPGTRGRFLMANGRGAVVDETDPLAASPWLAIADLDGDAREARVFRAAPLAQADVEGLFGQLIVAESVVAWDDREGAVQARRRRRLGAIPLKDDRWTDPPPEALVAATLDGIRRLGLAVLPWTRPLEQLRARVALVATAQAGSSDDAWPDFSDAGLTATLDDWLAPYLAGITRRSQFDRIDLEAALSARLTWAQRQRLDQLAPTHFDLPSGSRAAIDYRPGADPFLSVKLQEMLGQIETPTVAGGRVPLTIELLSPPGRPLQVTRDLVSFWRNGYVQVRAEMRGRYPKHDWPEDPFTAIPHRGTKRALQAALKKT